MVDRVATRERLRRHIEAVYASGFLIGDDGAERSIHPGGVSHEVGELLRDLAVREGVRKPIEVGLAGGMSTLFLCEALLASAPDDARHTAIDPLQTILFANVGRRSLEAAGVWSMIDFIEESSDLALPSLLGERGKGSFDFAFIDGAHWFDYAFVDAFLCYQLVRPGGVIVLDDTSWPGPYLAARYLITNLGCTEIGGFPQTMEYTGRGRLGRKGPHLTAIRTPARPTPRATNAFVDFFEPPESPADHMKRLARWIAPSVRAKLGRGRKR
jgi:predicted O-methyltransferase YrrM